MSAPPGCVLHFKFRSRLFSSAAQQIIFYQSRLSYPKYLEMNWFPHRKPSSSCAQPQPYTTSAINRGLSTADCDEESLYHYTSGRWLWNEKEQLSRRYVKFNPAELVRIATNVTGSKSCIQLKKLPEGNFSKVFLITMDDGKEIIAKLPNPNAGRRHFTTASEVATMAYVGASFLSYLVYDYFFHLTRL